MYAHPEKGDSVYILDPLSLDRFDAFQNEIKDVKNNKSEIDIMKDYGARWIEKVSKDPELSAILQKAKEHSIDRIK